MSNIAIHHSDEATSGHAIDSKSNLKQSFWIHSSSFDLVFVVGTLTLALASGLLVLYQPNLFYPVLLADLWLLGYHHVIATFTRLTFDGESFREHRFLVLVLPWLVLFGTIAAAYSLGTWCIATVYLYWQWFHYTRQSYGVSRVYLRKLGVCDLESYVTSRALYLVPLFGILYRSQQNGNLFLGTKVKKIPYLVTEYVGLPLSTTIGMTTALMNIAAVFSVVFVVWWLAIQVKGFWKGESRWPLVLYMMSHFIVFMTGYYLIADIDYGWLVINIWHNAQYILFVWWYNTRRFSKGVTSKQVFLSWLSQLSPKNVISYFAVTLGLSTLTYFLVKEVLQIGYFAAIPAASLVVFQAVNFHHYLVDGIIWKIRKPKIKGTLGIASS